MFWTGISIPVSSAWLLTCIFFEYGIKNIEFYNILNKFEKNYDISRNGRYPTMLIKEYKT